MLLAAGCIEMPAAEWVLLKISLPAAKATRENYSSTTLSTLENSISTGVERPKMLTITFNV